MTHCDFALEAQVDFLAVVEHRLIPARARSECDRLRRKGLASIWAPACQDSSHVGNAEVGVVSLRGAPVALPSFATSQFKVFFDCGRAVRCLLPLGAGRFMHLFVLYGYQGADTDAEQLALTDQLFDAALLTLRHIRLITTSWAEPTYPSHCRPHPTLSNEASTPTRPLTNHSHLDPIPTTLTTNKAPRPCAARLPIPMGPTQIAQQASVPTVGSTATLQC